MSWYFPFWLGITEEFAADFLELTFWFKNDLPYILWVKDLT